MGIFLHQNGLTGPGGIGKAVEGIGFFLMVADRHDRYRVFFSIAAGDVTDNAVLGHYLGVAGGGAFDIQ